MAASARIEVKWGEPGMDEGTLIVGYYLTKPAGPEHPGEFVEDPDAVGEFTREYNNLLNKPHLQNQQIAGNVTKLVLKGEGFTNEDFNGGKMGEFIAMCAGEGNTLYLDLTDASGLISYVEYTSIVPENDLKYIPSNGNPATKLVTINNAIKKIRYVYDDGWGNVTDFTDLVENGTLYQNNGKWYRSDWGGAEATGNNCPNKTIEVFADSNGNILDGEIVSSNANEDGTTYTVKYKKVLGRTPFAFGNIDQNNHVVQNYCGQYLNGITFPKGSNFTAIPDKLCCTSLCPNLETVVWGDQLEWIGAHAFRGGLQDNGTYAPASELKKIGTMDADGKVTFPKITLTETEGELSQGVVKFPNTLKVIGMDAFYECTDFRYVNLDLDNLVKVDAAAFNMYKDNLNQLDSVQMPSKTNTSLKFWGNQVFSASHIKYLDFRYCEGIKHFAYDGQNSMEEGTYNPVAGGVGSNTFYWHQYMTTLILPPNLAYVAGGSSANIGMTVECWRLKTIEFTGRGEYGTDCTITNGLIIPQNAFTWVDPVESANYNKPEFYNIGSFEGTQDKLRLLEKVILSDNITRINTQAFSLTSLQSIAIPASVQEIESKAFETCRLLTTVIFDDIREDCTCDPYPTHVTGDDGAQGFGAFNHCTAVTDVYINTSALLDCQNNAFDAATTWGRGDPGKNFATLHFPEENIDQYVNRKHYLTDAIAADDDAFHDWLMEHYDLAGIPNHNGWYEFVNSGISGGPDDPGTNEIILRTFSDWNNAFLVPDGLRAYAVNEIGTNEDGEFEITLKRLNVIPAKTGVILYGHPNGKTQNGAPTLAMTPVHFVQLGEPVYNNATGEIDHYYGDENHPDETESQGQALCRANWAENGGPNLIKNYLEPTSTPSQADVTKLTNKWESETDATKKAKLKEELDALNALIEANPAWKTQGGELNGGIYVKPYENEITETDPYDPYHYFSNKPVTYRNFAMGRYGSTKNLATNPKTMLGDKEDNYEAFFRMIAGYYSSGKAYLRLTKSEYSLPTGAQILVKKDESETISYHYEKLTAKNVPEGLTINAGDLFDIREYPDLNPKGWWIAENGFDWDIYDETSSKYGAPRKNWGKRSIRLKNAQKTNAPMYLGELGEEADGIVKLVIPADYMSMGDYYTLQGVKVTNPTKGVYIRNGKKVIIK